MENALASPSVLLIISGLSNGLSVILKYERASGAQIILKNTLRPLDFLKMIFNFREPLF